MADWLTDMGRVGSPRRVERWRTGGLLPAPAGLGSRTGSVPGRVPRGWTAEQLPDVRQLALRLDTLTGSGRSAAECALVLLAEGMPVPTATVVRCARDVLVDAGREIRKFFQLPEGMTLEDPWEDDGVLQRVDTFVGSRPDVIKAVSARINGVELSPDGPDAQALFVGLVGAALGVPPGRDDPALLDLMLHFLKAHGVVEYVGGTDVRMLPNGAADLADALERIDLATVTNALTGMTDLEVRASAGFWRDLGNALGAIPSEAAGFFAATAISAMSLSREPFAVAVRLAFYALMCRMIGSAPDISELSDQIYGQWGPPAEGVRTVLAGGAGPDI